MTEPHPYDRITPDMRAELDRLPTLERTRATLALKKGLQRRAARRLIMETTREAGELGLDVRRLANAPETLEVAATDPNVAQRLAVLRLRSDRAISKVLEGPAETGATAAARGDASAPSSRNYTTTPERFKRLVRVRRRRAAVKATEREQRS